MWARRKGDPSSQPFLFSPSSGPGLLCWLPPQWLCPGHWHGDWQVKLMGIWGGLLCAPQELSLDHLPLPSLLPQSLQRMIIRYTNCLPGLDLPTFLWSQPLSLIFSGVLPSGPTDCHLSLPDQLTPPLPPCLLLIIACSHGIQRLAHSRCSANVACLNEWVMTCPWGPSRNMTERR